MPEPYVPLFEDESNPGNEYRCFVIDPEVEENIYLTAMAPIVDQKAMVHHIVLFTKSADSIDEDEQGKGLMYEALRAGIEHVFGTMGMHRIAAGYLPTNERSGRLLRRLGFQVEGYARDYLFIHGRWRDHILTSLLSDKTIEPYYPRQP